MGRLIDADWLKTQWSEPTDWMDGDQVLHHYTWFKMVLELAPTVDAVPVVRCRDCKHHDGIRCFRWNSTIITGFEDFCSNGEQKDGDGND